MKLILQINFILITKNFETNQIVIGFMLDDEKKIVDKLIF